MYPARGACATRPGEAQSVALALSAQRCGVGGDKKANSSQVSLSFLCCSRQASAVLTAAAAARERCGQWARRRDGSIAPLSLSPSLSLSLPLSLSLLIY